MSVLSHGESLRARRCALGLTQTQLADLAEVSLSTVIRLEQEGYTGTVRTLQRILNVLESYSETANG